MESQNAGYDNAYNGKMLFKFVAKGFMLIAFPALIFLTAAFLWGINAATNYLRLNSEQNELCRYMVTAENITYKDIAYIDQINGVHNAAIVYDVDAAIRISGYYQDVMLTGVSGDFIVGEPVFGAYYSDDTASFNIVMNEAALMNMKNADGERIDEGSERDRILNMSVVIYAGDQHYVGKICGIVRDGEKEMPKGYISAPCGKMMLGEASGASGILVDLENADVIEQVEEKLSDYGYVVENYDPDQIHKWELMKQKKRYSLLLCIVALAAGCIIAYERIKYDGMVNADVYQTLQGYYSEHRVIRKELNVWRCVMLIVVAFLLGVVIYLGAGVLKLNTSLTYISFTTFFLKPDSCGTVKLAFSNISSPILHMFNG